MGGKGWDWGSPAPWLGCGFVCSAFSAGELGLELCGNWGLCPYLQFLIFSNSFCSLLQLVPVPGDCLAALWSGVFVLRALDLVPKSGCGACSSGLAPSAQQREILGGIHALERSVCLCFCFFLQLTPPSTESRAPAWPRTCSPGVGAAGRAELLLPQRQEGAEQEFLGSFFPAKGALRAAVSPGIAWAGASHRAGSREVAAASPSLR